MTIIEFVIIIDTEWSMVAMLYEPSDPKMRKCLSTLLPYKRDDSLFGWQYVLRNVGMNAIKSMETTVMTDTVGSLVINQGMSPRRARNKKYLSDLGGFLNPYLRDKKNIITVKISEAAVGIAPIPAPFDTWPKNTTHDTIVHTSHVYGCGFTFPLITSKRYGMFPAKARRDPTTTNISLTCFSYVLLFSLTYCTTNRKSWVQTN